MERRNFLQSKFNLKDCDLVALNPIKELEDIRNKLQIKNKEN
jgi:hypothetical protein